MERIQRAPGIDSTEWICWLFSFIWSMRGWLVSLQNRLRHDASTNHFAVHPMRTGVRYPVLTPNMKGLEAAMKVCLLRFGFKHTAKRPD